MEKVIQDFCVLCNQDMSLARLAPLLSTLLASSILQTLAYDPTNVAMQNCVRRMLDQQPLLPHDFLAKFLAVNNARISLRGSHAGFGQPEYTTTVNASRIEPSKRVNVMTSKLRKDEIRADLAKAQIVPRTDRQPGGTVKFMASPDILELVSQTIGDLEQTIIQGNEVNGYAESGYIPTTRRKANASAARRN